MLTIGSCSHHSIATNRPSALVQVISSTAVFTNDLDFIYIRLIFARFLSPQLYLLCFLRFYFVTSFGCIGAYCAIQVLISRHIVTLFLSFCSSSSVLSLVSQYSSNICIVYLLTDRNVYQPSLIAKKLVSDQLYSGSQ